MIYYTDICILGTGPTARICSFFLKNKKHIIVGNGQIMGSLSKVKIQDRELNLIPIFPVYKSTLYNELWRGCNDKHNFLEYKDYGDVDLEYDKIKHNLLRVKPDSYVAINLKKKCINTKKNILLSLKQFGDIIFEKRLFRLDDKVKRHYEDHLPKARIGFVNSLSPYYEKLRDIHYGDFLYEDIKEIDTEKKRVITTKFEIKYQRLISTLSLKEMLNKVKEAPKIQLISKPASFFVFKTVTSLPPHKVIYDLGLDSPIYRIFTIDFNIIIVQLSYFQTLENDILKQIFNRLKQLFWQDLCIEYDYYYSIKDAYPLDSSSDIELNQFVSKLDANDIVLLKSDENYIYK